MARLLRCTEAACGNAKIVFPLYFQLLSECDFMDLSPIYIEFAPVTGCTVAATKIAPKCGQFLFVYKMVIFCNIFLLCVRVSRFTYRLTKIKMVVGVMRMVFKTSIHL